MRQKFALDARPRVWSTACRHFEATLRSRLEGSNCPVKIFWKLRPWKDETIMSSPSSLAHRKQCTADVSWLLISVINKKNKKKTSRVRHGCRCALELNLPACGNYQHLASHLAGNVTFMNWKTWWPQWGAALRWWKKMVPIHLWDRELLYRCPGKGRRSFYRWRKSINKWLCYFWVRRTVGSNLSSSDYLSYSQIVCA